MEMGKEVIDKILSLGVPNTVRFGEFEYTDKPLTLMKPPTFEVHKVNTLKGLAALTKEVAKQFDAPLMVVINDHWLITVRSVEYNQVNEYSLLIGASPIETERFPFGRYMPVEEFCIHLLTKCVPDEHMHELYKLASAVTGECIRQADDNGIAQRTTIKTGPATRADVQIKLQWLLRPYRTFLEITQPASPFLFRLRQEKDQSVSCALFEVDGGAWKIEAKAALEAWLTAALPDVLIVA